MPLSNDEKTLLYGMGRFLLLKALIAVFIYKTAKWARSL